MITDISIHYSRPDIELCGMNQPVTIPIETKIRIEFSIVGRGGSLSGIYESDARKLPGKIEDIKEWLEFYFGHAVK